MQAHGINIIDIESKSGLRIQGSYNEVDWYGPVRVNGVVLDPKASLKVANHSPTGFAWGYSGSGPTQLALAILLKAGLKKDAAIAFCIRFRDTFISRLPQSEFDITVDVNEWVKTCTSK